MGMGTVMGTGTDTGTSTGASRRAEEPRAEGPRAAGFGAGDGAAPAKHQVASAWAFAFADFDPDIGIKDTLVELAALGPVFVAREPVAECVHMPRRPAKHGEGGGVDLGDLWCSSRGIKKQSIYLSFSGGRERPGSVAQPNTAQWGSRAARSSRGRDPRGQAPSRGRLN